MKHRYKQYQKAQNHDHRDKRNFFLLQLQFNVHLISDYHVGATSSINFSHSPLTYGRGCGSIRTHVLENKIS